METPVARRIVERIHRLGPIRFDDYVELALYDPEGGFFAAGGGAGRARGDFLTSPEVGSLFGALVARQLDRWWRELGEPDPYVVIDAGAGRGQLARDVLRADPACAPALRYVMVERSPILRRLQQEHLQLEPTDEALGPAVKLGDDDDDPELVPGTGPIVTQTEDLPAVTCTGAVIANELLDNLPFRVVERRSGRWHEVRVGVQEGSGVPASAGGTVESADAEQVGPGAFVEVLVPAEPDLEAEAGELLPDAPDGTRIPVQVGIRRWLDECGRALRRGFVAVVDYAEAAGELAARGTGWLRTYRGHGPGGPALEAPGTQDITSDVVLETLHEAARDLGFAVVDDLQQAEWLGRLGIEELVEEGREVWRERAHLGDLEALRGRSRVSEAEALAHPTGLGGHRVVILRKGG